MEDESAEEEKGKRVKLEVEGKKAEGKGQRGKRSELKK